MVAKILIGGVDSKGELREGVPINNPYNLRHEVLLESSKFDVLLKIICHFTPDQIMDQSNGFLCVGDR